MRVLFVIPGYHGHIQPTYALADALIKAGNLVTYCVPSPIFRERIEAMGALYIEIPDFLNQIQKSDKKTEETKLSEESFLSSLNDHEYTKLYIATCDKYYESDTKAVKYFFNVIQYNQYDLIIGDKLYNFGMLLAKTYQIPFIQSDYHIFHVHENEYDIMRLAHLSLEQKKYINKDCFERFNSYLKICCSVPMGSILPIDAYIKAYNDPVHHVIVYAPKILFQNDRAISNYENYLFLGNRFDKILDIAQLSKKELYSNDNIYISLGTIMNLRFSIFKTALEILGKSTYNVTISCGGANEIFEKLSVANIYDNIHIFLFLNQKEILLKTDVFITHGGANSVYEALYYSVPMILIPNGGDQIENSKMVERLKVGKAILSYDNNFLSDLEKALQNIKNDYQLYKENTEKVQNWLLQSSKPSEIVIQIEHLLSTKRENLLMYVEEISSKSSVECTFSDYYAELFSYNMCAVDSNIIGDSN